jgi:hypothetical protein
VGSDSNIAREPSQPYAEAARIAARQHGNITTAQLRAVGFTDDGIAYAVRRGRLYRVYPGVYALGRPPSTVIERSAAAVLACGAGALLSHTSALALWGFAKEWPPQPHVTVPGDRRPRHIVVHRSAVLTRADRRTQLGIRATSPARTLLDSVPLIDPARVARTVNDALVSPFLTRPQLTAVTARFPRHKGVALLAPFIDLTDGPTRSQFEDAFLRFCEHYGLPRPRVNAVIAGHLVDAVFDQARLIVELDSWRFHAERGSFESDRDRDADTLAAGHATVRVTWTRLAQRASAEARRLHRIVDQRPGASGAPPS